MERQGWGLSAFPTWLCPGDTVCLTALPNPCPPLCMVRPMVGCGAAVVVGSRVLRPFLGGHWERWVVSVLPADGFCGARCQCRG